MDLTEGDKKFVNMINELSESLHATSVNHGFWDGKQNFAEKIALIHSELSEALEAHRNMSPTGEFVPDVHCPEYTNLEIELADAIIRILDLGQGWGMRVAEAVIAKARYNMMREYKHGKSY